MPDTYGYVPISDGSRALLQQTMTLTREPNMDEAAERAISLYAFCWKQRREKGASFFMRLPDGSTQEVELQPRIAGGTIPPAP